LNSLPSEQPAEAPPESFDSEQCDSISITAFEKDFHGRFAGISGIKITPPWLFYQNGVTSFPAAACYSSFG
jgi:hypothetical protein